MIFYSIFSAFACLETPYVYVTLARGVLYHPAWAARNYWSQILSLSVALMHPVNSRPVTGYILLATYKLDGTL